MAEEQKPAVEAPEVAKTETATADQAVTAEPAPAVDAKPADETKPVEATEAADVKVDGKKDEVKPVEEGHLGHKAQGASFPKCVFPPSILLSPLSSVVNRVCSQEPDS